MGLWMCCDRSESVVGSASMVIGAFSRGHSMLGFVPGFCLVHSSDIWSLLRWKLTNLQG